ncbi:MAG: hypothetical protein K0Q43_222 [Ramlibacter sp.]|jgi:hypothetical protein|nr:hypothetical protein [Ramlibacter sp.]
MNEAPNLMLGAISTSIRAARQAGSIPALTHDTLVTRAGGWLRSVGCGLVLTEVVSIQAETPDAIGWRDAARESFLVECKTSRADFRADRHKAFRMEPETGMGSFRYYMCPPGLIRAEDLPPRWGLLYCHPKVIEIVSGRHPRRYDRDRYTEFVHANVAGELRMMYSALSRLKIDLGERKFFERIHLPYSDRKKERAS